MNIGIIGSGVVGRALGAGFLKHGRAVMIGSREPRKLDGWIAQNPGALAGDFADAAKFGDVLVLAVKGSAAAAALRLAGPSSFSGKTIIDATNPIADSPPEKGVLRFFTTLEESLMERLQRDFPAARFVKAFSSVGNAWMVNPSFPGGEPTMFICGNDDGAKKTVASILGLFGWETADMGAAEAARAIEPLCILWCIPGLLRNEWSHAFKLMRMS